MTESRQYREYTTSGIILAFARFGVAIGTISRALVASTEHVEQVCTQAFRRGDLQMIPPRDPTDTRTASLVELVNLRNKVSELQAELRAIRNNSEDDWVSFLGVAGLSKHEAKLVAALVKHGRLSKERIYHALYGDDIDAPLPKVIDVFVCKTRSKLRPFGIEIDTVWGFGYELTRPNLEAVRAIAGLPVHKSPPLAPVGVEAVA